jgi:hypothetical protein
MSEQMPDNPKRYLVQDIHTGEMLDGEMSWCIEVDETELTDAINNPSPTAKELVTFTPEERRKLRNKRRWLDPDNTA